MNNDLDTSSQKAVDTTSTFTQVLVGLASGIIAAILAFYPNIIHIPHFNFDLLKVSLSLFLISVVAGVISFMGLITVLQRPPSVDGGKTATGNSERWRPVAYRIVTGPAAIQVISFVAALLMLLIILWLTINFQTSQSFASKLLIEDAVQALRHNDAERALIHLIFADHLLMTSEEDQTLMVHVENAIQALQHNDSKAAGIFLKTN